MEKDTKKWIAIGLILVALSACGMVVTGGIMDKDVLVDTGRSILIGIGVLAFFFMLWTT